MNLPGHTGPRGVLYGRMVVENRFDMLHSIVDDVIVPQALEQAGKAGRDESARIAGTRVRTGLMHTFLLTSPVNDFKGWWIMWWTPAKHAWVHDRGTHDGRIKPLDFLMKGRLHGKRKLQSELGQQLRRILG
jgi:hypothetical protein